MFRSFFGTKEWAAWAYCGGLSLVLLLWGQVYCSVLLNEWRKEFYDLLQVAAQHHVEEFWALLKNFTWIAMPWVVAATVTQYVTRVYALKWREAITTNYLPRWAVCKNDIEGSSQRIQEDTAKFAKIVETLGKELVSAIMTLIAFIPILWTLSDSVGLVWMKNIPGSLVWMAFITSVGGMIVSWYVGIKLPGLEYNNQKAEAAFRKELVLNENSSNRTLSLVPTMLELFVGVKLNYHKLFLHYGYFNVWSNVYYQAMIIAPYIVIAPSLFTGAITLGILAQVTSAFNSVHQSFSTFIDNWTTITELRSIHKRLKEFEAAL